MSFTVVLCSLVGLCLSSCDKPPSGFGTGSDASGKGRREPRFLRGDTFRSLDDGKVLVFVSADELELRERTSWAHSNFICKYTEDAQQIRVVATISGTQQAFYYRVTKDGLIDERGLTLYNAASLPVAIAAANALREQRELQKRLRSACYDGNLAAVNELLARGAKVNDTVTPRAENASQDDSQPLKAAASRDTEASLEIVKLLLAKGADVHARSSLNIDGQTALSAAISWPFGFQFTGRDGHITPDARIKLEKIRLLLEAGAIPEPKWQEGGAQFRQALDPPVSEYWKALIALLREKKPVK